MPRTADPRAKITLLRAAEEIFAERGLLSAKVEDIARRANVSKGAFYLHFDSKEAALKQIVETFLARCGSYFAPPGEYPDVPEGADELLDFCIERDAQIYEFLWQNRAILRILTTCQAEYRYLVDAFRAEIDHRNRAWIEHFLRIGLFRAEVDPELCATLIGGAYNELTAKMVRAGSRPPLEDWLRFAQDTFLRGFGSPALIEVVARRNSRVSFGTEAGAIDARERERL